MRMPTVFIAWTMWFFVTIFYAYQYVLRVFTGTIIDELTQKFSVGPLEIGNFSGIYYIGYTLAHIPIGIILDKVGIKKVIPFCITFTFAGLLPLIYCDDWMYSVFGRCVTGVASSASVLGLFKIVNLCFDEKKFSRMVGIAIFIGVFGAICGGGPVSYLVSRFGFELIVKALCIFGMALALLTYFVIPSSIDAKNTKHSNLLAELRSIIMNPRVMYLSFLGGLMIGPLEGFADAWGVKFIQLLYDIPQDESSSIISIIFVGMGIGSFLLAYINEKVGSLYNMLLLCAIIMLLSFIVIFTGMCNILMLYILMFILGFVSGYQILIVGRVRSFTVTHLSTITSAIANIVIMIFGYFFHTVIGLIIHSYSHDVAQNGVNDILYITYGLCSIPIALLVAILGFIPILIYKKRWGY